MLTEVRNDSEDRQPGTRRLGGETDAAIRAHQGEEHCRRGGEAEKAAQYRRHEEITLPCPDGGQGQSRRVHDLEAEIPSLQSSVPLEVHLLQAVKEVVGERIPPISSTKSLTGHSQGATGVHEAIYALLMMENGFISASANIEELDPEAEGVPIVRERRDGVTLDCVLSNSFGFGGTNATLAFKRLEA